MFGKYEQKENEYFIDHYERITGMYEQNESQSLIIMEELQVFVYEMKNFN